MKLKNPLMRISAFASTYLLSMSAYASPSGSGSGAGVQFTDMANQTASTIYSAGSLVSTASYIGGAAMGMKAMIGFKQHAENTSQMPINKPLGALAVSAGLVALPFVINTTLNSVGADNADSGVGITDQSGNRF